MNTKPTGDSVAQATTGGIERDSRGWPILRASELCEGCNPMTGLSCVGGDHKGYHRDASGAEWLDD